MHESELEKAKRSIRDLAKADFLMLNCIARDSWLNATFAFLYYLTEFISVGVKALTEEGGE